MFTALFTYANGRRETVDVEIIDKDYDASPLLDKPYHEPVVERAWSERLPAGVKRLPQVGEVWSTPSGSLAAVVSQATILDGGFNCVVLTKGSTTAMPGRSFVVDLDGNWLGSKEPVGDRHPLALKSFVRRFDIDERALDD